MGPEINAMIIEKGGNSNLVFEISKDVRINKERADLINSRALEGAAHIDFGDKPGYYLLTYDMGRMISLSKLLRLRPVSEKTVCTILLNILDVISGAGAIQTQAGDFTLDMDYIYVDFLKNNVKLAFFPFDTGVKTADRLRGMIRSLSEAIEYNVRAPDSRYMEKLVKLCENNDFSTEYFRQCLCTKINKFISVSCVIRNILSIFGKAAKRDQAAGTKMPPDGVKPERESFPPNRRTVALLSSSMDTGRTSATEDNKAAKVFQCLIKISDGNNVTETFVGKYPFKIGRRRDSDYRIDDETVSREHARLEIEDGRLYVTDTDSKSGVYVNGLKIESSARRLLNENETLEIGRVKFEILRISEVE